MQYWLVNSGTAEDPYVPPRDDWQERHRRWAAEHGDVHMFSRRPTIAAGDRLVHHAVGSAAACGDGEGRIFAVAEVVADPAPSGHPRWPWLVRRRLLAGEPVLRHAPRLSDIGVSRRSLLRHSHIRLSVEQGRRAERLLRGED